MYSNFLKFALLLLFVSCTEDPKECIGYKSAFVTDVNAPSTGKINETVEIEVDFMVTNGCGKFEKFIESGNEFFKTIEVQAKYEGCICPTVIKEIKVIYEFTPVKSGEYKLRFRSGETEFINVDLPITD